MRCRCSGLLVVHALNSALLAFIGVAAFVMGYPDAMVFPLIMQSVLSVVAALVCLGWEREEEVQEEV